MIRIAIPMFRERVSPVFDSCTRLFLMDVEAAHEIDRRELYLDALSLTERVSILRKSGVQTVICGGISSVLANMLSGAKISLISDISGDMEQVLAAYLAGSLDDSRFRMPGVCREAISKNVMKGGDRHENR